MKLILSAVTAMLFMVGTANAQHGNAHSAFGVKAGLNLYNIHNDNNVDYDTKVGFNAGFLGHMHLAKHIALQPEITYSLQGAKYNVPGLDVDTKLGYINVPVLVQYMFDNGFRIQAGPQVGFLVNAKSELNNTTVDIKDQLKTVDFGIGAGLSYVHPASGLGIDARYNFGLSNINDNGSVKSNNRGAQIGLFYLIHR